MDEPITGPDLDKFWNKQKVQDQYKVNDIPVHSHTGSDSPQIDFGDIVNKTFVVSVTIHGTSAATSANYSTFFTAQLPCILTAVSEVHATAATVGSPTLTIEKLVSGTAPGGGITLVTPTFDLTSTINTPVFGTIVRSYTTTGAANATIRNCNLAVGDSLALKVTGTLTSLANVSVTCQFQLQ